MAKESRYDSYELIPPDCGMWENASYVDDSAEHFLSSTNFTLTEKRSLRTRFGFSLKIGDTFVGGQVKKLWVYETFSPASTSVYSYMIASAQDQATGYFLLYWISAGGVAWNAVSTLRACNTSTRPHMIAFSKGLAYVKSFPSTLSGEKLGTVILDGTSGTIQIKPWGLLGPDTPAQLSGQVTKLTADVTATATTLNVTSTAAFPAAPFPIWVGSERMNVTAKGATTFTVTRAYSGTTAAVHQALEAVFYYDWGASDHIVDVTIGWAYSYAYKSITGAISNRADIQRNPDLMPSMSGPIKDQVPKVILQGHADTTNIPTIQVYRSTNGLQSFFLLEEIANPGAGPFTYYDDSFGTGATSSTYNDPVPDNKLDTSTFAATLTSNSPPPTVVPPQVIGVDDPSPQSYAMTTHVRRIFFSVGNYLYYSSSEETRCGIPEESFATDLSSTGANYIAFNDVVTALTSDNESLWIFTTKNIYRMFGFTKDSFYVTKAFDIGAKLTNLNAAAQSSNGQIAFIATSGAIYTITDNGSTLTRISDAIAFNSGFSQSPDLSLYFYKNATKEFLYLACTGVPSPTSTDIYVYDVGISREKRRPVWISKWSIGGLPCAFGAFESYNPVLTGVFIGNTNLSNSIVAQLQENTFYAPTDLLATGSSSNITYSLITMPIRIPPGNHVNTFNRPTRDTKATRVFTFTYPIGGTFSDPVVTISCDNSGAATQPTAEDPPRIDFADPGTYTISVFTIDKDVYRVILTLSGEAGKYTEYYGFVVEFEPHYTATEV